MNVPAILTKDQISFALISVGIGYVCVGKQKWELHSDIMSELRYIYNDM